MTCLISRIQYGHSITVELLVTTCQLILFQACGQHFFLRLLINKQHLCFVKLRGRAVAEAEKLKSPRFSLTLHRAERDVKVLSNVVSSVI